MDAFFLRLARAYSLLLMAFSKLGEAINSLSRQLIGVAEHYPMLS